MTTDQRERTERGGFRLPWGHDRRSDSEQTNEPTASGEDAASWVLRAGATTEPADGTQVEDRASEATDAREQPAAEVPAAPDASGAADQADGADEAEDAEGADAADDPRAGLAWPATDVRRDAGAQPESASGQEEATDGEDAEPPVDQADGQAGEADASADADGDAESVAGADEPVAAEESEPSAEAGADSPERQADAPSMASSMPPSLAAALSASGSRPTAFLKELTKAMQAAAATARDEAIARLAEEAKRRTDEIQEAGTTRATRLRKSSEEDVTATREWSKTEIARIREEAEQRIAERKARLESELEQHADLVKRRTEQLHEVVEAHEHELAAFIDQLMAEDDPTRIATLAQHLPETPTLPVLDPDDDAVEETAEASSQEEASGTPTAGASEDGDAPADTDGGSDQGGDAATEPTMDQLTAEFAAAAEAEALADLDGDDGTGWLTGTAGSRGSKGATATDGIRTELLVTGLSSVAGIAGFKRELSRMDGVHAVAVSAGQAGDFVFSVTHTADLDLAAGIASITSFQATVHDQQEETLLVSATEPDAE